MTSQSRAAAARGENGTTRETPQHDPSVDEELECMVRVNIGGVVKHLGVFSDVLRAHHGRIAWEDEPRTAIIAGPTEADLMAITEAVSRAVQAARSRGLLDSTPVFICEPPSTTIIGTHVTFQDISEGHRPTMATIDKSDDIMSLVDVTPDRQEYLSRITSTLFFWLRSLQYVRGQVNLRIQFGYVQMSSRPAVTNLSWPTFSDFLASPTSQWTLTMPTKVSKILDSIIARTDLFWPTDHEQKDTLSVAFASTTIEVELDFSGSVDDGSYRLQLAGGSAWLPDETDGHGLEVVSASPALAMDWGFHGTSRHPDRSAVARKLAAGLQRGVKYLNENPVEGCAVPRFSIPRQGQEKVVRTILRRPHRFMYKDSAWCVEVTESYVWSGSVTTATPAVECLVSAFQHEWDDRLRPLEGVHETRPWTQNPNMPEILPGADTDVEVRLAQVVDFTEELRFFLAEAAARVDRPEQSKGQS